jgi:hypothetical protein
MRTERNQRVKNLLCLLVNIRLNYNEKIEFGRVFGRMVGEGIQPEPMGRMIPQFVADYEPVTTTKVAETFEPDQDQALEKFGQRENIAPRDFGAGTFWFSV